MNCLINFIYINFLFEIIVTCQPTFCCETHMLNTQKKKSLLEGAGSKTQGFPLFWMVPIAKWEVLFLEMFGGHGCLTCGIIV